MFLLFHIQSRTSRLPFFLSVFPPLDRRRRRRRRQWSESLTGNDKCEICRSFFHCHWGVHWGRRFNVSMVRRTGRQEGRKGREGSKATGWTDGRRGRTHSVVLPPPLRPPPTRNGPPADTRQIPTILYQLSFAVSESETRQTSTSRRPPARARTPAVGRGRPKKRARQHKYSISPTYCYSNYLCLPLSSLLPSFAPSPRSYTPDGWMDFRWMVDTWGMELVGSGFFLRRRRPIFHSFP